MSPVSATPTAVQGHEERNGLPFSSNQMNAHVRHGMVSGYLSLFAPDQASSLISACVAFLEERGIRVWPCFHACLFEQLARARTLLTRLSSEPEITFHCCAITRKTGVISACSSKHHKVGLPSSWMLFHFCIVLGTGAVFCCGCGVRCLQATSFLETVTRTESKVKHYS
jgi:hypothetical protein